MRHPALLASLLATAVLPAADLLETNRDPAVAPTADFWRHANARWNAAHPLAADRASYYSYDWLEDLIRTDVLRLHRDLLAATGDLTPAQRQIADFWRSALAFESGPAELPAGVRAILGRLDEARTPQQLLEIAADLSLAGVGSYVGVGADQDARDEHHVVVLQGQSGLSLPEKSYYLGTELEPQRVREAFPAHVARLLAHVGYPRPGGDGRPRHPRVRAASGRGLPLARGPRRPGEKLPQADNRGTRRVGARVALG